MDVTIGLAFVGGIVSFLSPCVLPVVPVYFSFLVGSSVQDGVTRRKLLIQALLFVAGFSMVFVLLGLSASTIGRLIGGYKPLLGRVGGAIVLVFGLHMIGLIRIPWLMMEHKVQLESSKPGGLRALILGLSFAAGWTPCIGPILSSILFMAGSSGSPGTGALLLAIYSLGLAIPFMLAALAAGHLAEWLRKSGRFVQIIQIIGGVILVVVGLLLIFDFYSRLSGYMPTLPLPY